MSMYSKTALRKMRQADIIDRMGQLHANKSTIKAEIKALEGELRRRKADKLRALGKDGTLEILGNTFKVSFVNFPRLFLSRPTLANYLVRRRIAKRAEVDDWIDNHCCAETDVSQCRVMVK